MDVAHSRVDRLLTRSPHAQTTILLVDDDPLILSVLSAVLTNAGYEVVAASSPSLALELAANQAFSMVVTDYQMPGMDGFSMAHLLVQMQLALPVLLISGSAPDELPLAQIAKREWNFLPKPLDRARLLRIVEGHCLSRALRKES